MDMCSSGAQWWSCSFDNQFYTGCCSVNACHQTPVGCPTTPPTFTATVTLTSLSNYFTLPHLIETKSLALASATATPVTGTSDLSMTRPLEGGTTVMTSTTALSFTSSSLTRIFTSAVHPHNESTSASPGSPKASGLTDGATVSPGSDHSMPTPAIVVLALVGVLFVILGSVMVWRGWKRRRERMKPSSSRSSPGGDDSTAAQEQEEEMGEHFNVLVNPEAFPFTPLRGGGRYSDKLDSQASTNQTTAGPGNRKSSATSFDSTARPVSAASMRPARYTNASPTLGDTNMDGGPVYDARYTNARYTNASPTLGEMDSGPSTYARVMGDSPTLEEHDGRPPFGSETHVFPPPTIGRALSSSPYTEGGQRNGRLRSAFGRSPRVAGSSSWANVWADNGDGQLKGGRKV